MSFQKEDLTVCVAPQGLFSDQETSQTFLSLEGTKKLEPLWGGHKSMPFDPILFLEDGYAVHSFWTSTNHKESTILRGIAEH